MIEKKCGGKPRVQYIKHLGFLLGLWPKRRSTSGLYTYFSDGIMTPPFSFFLFFFFFPSLLSPLLVSVLNLLCNEVTQGLGMSPGTNHQGFSASCDGQTRGSDFTAPGTNKHRATAAALARMKKATRLHASAQH